jgi:hypothetical protein
MKLNGYRLLRMKTAATSPSAGAAGLFAESSIMFYSSACLSVVGEIATARQQQFPGPAAEDRLPLIRLEAYCCPCGGSRRTAVVCNQPFALPRGI